MTLSRLASLVTPLTLFSLASCGNDAAPLRVGMVASQLTLDRLDSQLHLRVFPRGNFRCDTARGRVLLDGQETTEIPGKNARADERCGANWASLRAMYGEASPVDQCVSREMPRQSLSIPSGNYLVLVEGSGTVTGPGGTTRTITLGSGCAEVDAAPGATIAVTIAIEEQVERGRCGDGQVQADELCDDGMPTARCNAKCRFPERVVSELTEGSRRNPTIAWNAGQPLVLGFHTIGDRRDDVWVHLFDANGEVQTTPAALANDHTIDATPTSVQRNLRLNAAPNGYVATWETSERTFANFDINGTWLSNFNAPAPPPMDLLLNPTSNTAMQNRTNPAIAASSSGAVCVFELPNGTLRTSALPAGGGRAPTADAALVAASAPGGAAMQAPVIASSSDGSFVAAWSAGAAGARDVYAVRVAANGTSMGMPVRVNGQQGSDQDQVAIAVGGADVFFAWRDSSRTAAEDMDGTTIRWRRFSSALAPMGDDITAVATGAGEQAHPTLAFAGGALLVAWEHSADGTVRGRFFAPGGSPQANRVNGSTGDFVVNASADEMGPGQGPRTMPTAGAGGNDRFAVAWEDQGTRNVHFRTLVR